MDLRLFVHRDQREFKQRLPGMTPTDLVLKLRQKLQEGDDSADSFERQALAEELQQRLNRQKAALNANPAPDKTVVDSAIDLAHGVISELNRGVWPGNKRPKVVEQLLQLAEPLFKSARTKYKALEIFQAGIT